MIENFDIQEELKKLPTSPGVYLMHNSRDEIIYVGKAINLKNRVRQYFQSSRNKTTKIQQMVYNIQWFEYIITDTELEALVLESNLIKEHRPRYNTMLKDDKSYPFIKVTTQEAFPRILFSRDRKKDHAKYFGPYTSAESVKDTIELLHKLFQLRTCNRNLPRDTGKERPCLNYHLKQCSAPCQGKISQEEYKVSIQQALDFLEGRNYKQVENILTEKMMAASEKMDFETAAGYRDLLYSVKKIEEKQKITASDHEYRDIIALASDERDAVVQVFFIRDGRLLGQDYFHVNVAGEEEPAQILEDFIKQFYTGTPYIPRELYLQYAISDSQLIERWLSARKGQKVSLRVPVRGEKARLVDLAAKNARLMLAKDKEKVRREHLRTVGAVKEIADYLHLAHIRRMEAYDISNTSGFESVGSMVVFEDGKPKRNDYRKFKIKSVEGPNDYASMNEVLTRRFSHGLEEMRKLDDQDTGKFNNFPDLILMDGGRGQVNIALEVLERLQLEIPVCGMVKDDHHRTRGLYYNNIEVPIDTHSEAFRLITRIQDEAHRFAIEYHKSLRGKTQVHSILDDIPGIGPTRRKALMKTYQSLDDIRNATVPELAEIPGMNKKSAENVYQFLHPVKNETI